MRTRTPVAALSSQPSQPNMSEMPLDCFRVTARLMPVICMQYRSIAVAPRDQSSVLGIPLLITSVCFQLVCFQYSACSASTRAFSATHKKNSIGTRTRAPSASAPMRNWRSA